VKDWFNRLLDHLSDFLAHRKGLLPFLGIVLVVVNGIIQFIPGSTWVAESNLFLHIGVIVAILGFMLAWAL
jgi:hypothetical protein